MSDTYTEKRVEYSNPTMDKSTGFKKEEIYTRAKEIRDAWRRSPEGMKAYNDKPPSNQSAGKKHKKSKRSKKQTKKHRK